jgi:Fe2+ or Zn2+ uptake regulation protein
MTPAKPLTKQAVMVLELLKASDQGLYGSDFIKLSKGKLTCSSIYNILDRLCGLGLLREAVDPPTSSYRMPRTRHHITWAGERALAMTLQVTEPLK